MIAFNQTQSETTSASSAFPVTAKSRRKAMVGMSTGPRTAIGKSKSRRNSVTHGLTANPAASTIEDGRQFKRLLRSLRAELLPASVVEEALVHRIAVACWRLQRAARSDSAVWDTAINESPPARVEVQDYVQQVFDRWRSELVEDPDAADAHYRKINKLPPAKVLVRQRLGSLDDYRENVMMRDGSAIMAMVAIIDELVSRLHEEPRSFNCFAAEQLAWAMGESTRRLARKEDEARFPGEYPGGTTIDRLILSAARREQGEPISDALQRAIDRRVTVLRIQSQQCERPYTDQAWNQRVKQVPFATENVLDRLLRYETHAERSLHRNLDALAKLRGTTAQSIIARVRQRAGDGARVGAGSWESNSPA